ncbi:hypothetical protein [Aestuariivirga sp.]|uniref:hypothetical protein n=1 Tax=Aestuariivirga sp. TaxID=2650926 RepID=UPI003BAA89B7
MTLLPRRSLAVLLALPAALVPIIEVPLVVWARHSFLFRHPDYADDPPTISRAISDPSIGAPFATVILVITGLIALALPVIFWAYLVSISRMPAGRSFKTALYGLAFLTLACQIAASFGMVLTSQYTFSIDRDLHMLGSYIFFAAQAVTILLAATLCRVLLHLQQKYQLPEESYLFRPGMHRFRFRFALVIVALAVLYGVLFFVKDHTLPISAYVVQIAYTQCEVLVISAFVLFLGSYAVDIHAMVHRGLIGAPAALPE